MEREDKQSKSKGIKVHLGLKEKAAIQKAIKSIDAANYMLHDRVRENTRKKYWSLFRKTMDRRPACSDPSDPTMLD